MRWLFLLLALSFSSCHCSELSVSDIKKYAKTEHAVRSNVAEFFERRMKNRPRKALVGNWEILFEDEENVYYGFPRFKGLFSNERVVEKFYFLPIRELEQQFPAYKKVSGIELRIRIYTSIKDYQKKKKDKSDFTLSANDWSAILKDDRIDVQATTRSRNPETKEQNSKKYELILNKNDLNLLKLEQK